MTAMEEAKGDESGAHRAPLQGEPVAAPKKDFSNTFGFAKISRTIAVFSCTLCVLRVLCG